MGEMEEFLSIMAGVPVELIEPEPGSWIAAPKVRTMAKKTRLWQALRAGPAAGVGTSPVGAALLLAMALGRCNGRPVAKRLQAQAWLKEALAGGALAAGEVKAQGQARGLSWSVLDRAARDIQVRRKKAGIVGPWFWSLG